MSDTQIPLFDASNPPTPGSEWDEQLLQPIPIQKEQAISLTELVPEDAVVRFTNNYDLSSTIISRFLMFFNDPVEKATKSLQATLSSELALPSERVRGLMNFARRMDLLTAENQLTSLARIYIKYDPFFLNVGGLWFLHYFVSSNAFIASWSRLFNSIFYQVEEVSPSDMPLYYKDLQANATDKWFSWNGAKELGAILRTYSDSLFKPLGMVIRVDTGRYVIITDEFDIHPLIWLSSILAYRDRYYPGAASLETHLIVDAHFSPGRLFRQKEERIRQVLDTLHTQGLITVESRLGLDQVRFKREVTWISAIASYFEEGK